MSCRDGKTQFTCVAFGTTLAEVASNVDAFEDGTRSFFMPGDYGLLG